MNPGEYDYTEDLGEAEEVETEDKLIVEDYVDDGDFED